MLDNTDTIATGIVARAPMRDPKALETTLQALLVAGRHQAIAIGGNYDDVAIEIAAYRADPSDETAMNLAKAGEGLLCRMDDLRWNTSPEWDAAADAVNPYIV